MQTTSGKDDSLSALTSVVTHVALIKSITDWRAGTYTEADYTGYSRKAISWSAAGNTTDSDGRQVSNSGAILFDINTGADQDVIGYALMTASTAGTTKEIGLFGSIESFIGAVDPSTDTVLSYGHGLSADNRVFVMKAPFANSPDVFAENTAYFVLASGLTANAFALSATSGGAAVNPTTDGILIFLPYTATTITTDSAFNIAANAIKIQR